MKRYIILPLILLIMSLTAGMASAIDADTGMYTNKTLSKKGIGYKYDIKYPLFLGNDPVSNATNEDLKEFIDSMVFEFQKASTGVHEHTYTLTSEYEVKSSDENTKSVVMYFNEYTGGAHNNATSYTVNYILVNGKAKRFDASNDLLADSKKLSKIVLKGLNAQKKEKGFDPVSSIDPKLLKNFVMDEKGVTWIFDPYTVGSFAEGTYKVFVSVDDLINAAVEDIPGNNDVGDVSENAAAGGSPKDAAANADTKTSTKTDVNTGDADSKEGVKVVSKTLEDSAYASDPLPISGTIHINGSTMVPAGSKLRVSLRLDNKAKSVLETYEYPFTGSDMPFNVLLRIKMNDYNPNGYVVFFEIVDKNKKRIFVEEKKHPIKSAGWKNKVVINMKKL